MSTSTVLAQLLFRRGTGGEWGTANTVLANGEPGWSYDQQVLKVGDGHTPWSDLQPLSLDPAVLEQIEQAAADAEAAADRAEAVGDTNDLITAGLVNDPTSQTTTALKSKYAPASSSGAIPVGKGELVFRITDPPFNAPLDGTTSATAAINAASAAAAAAGVGGAAIGKAVVEFPYIPAGYTANSLLILHSGVTYRGDRHVQIKRTGVAANYLFDLSAKTDVVVEGLAFNGNGNINIGVVACGTGTRIRDCWFTDAVQLGGCYPVNFAPGTTPVINVTIGPDNRFTNMRNAIHIRGNTQRVTVFENDISGYGATAIAVDGDATTRSTDLMIRNNRCHDHDATVRAVTTKRIIGNVATLDLGSAVPAAWVVGYTVYVDINDTAYDGNHALTAVGATTVSWAKTAADSGPTASTGYVAAGNRQPISVQGDDSELSFHERITITENQLIGNYVNHQQTTNGGTADMISVHHTKTVVATDNIVEGGGDCGITISFRCSKVTVSGNTITGTSNAGVAVGASTAVYVKGINISGNNITNCGQNPAMGTWASAGVNLRKVQGGAVFNNYFGDDQTVPTMWYGISVGDTTGTSSDVRIGENQYVNLVTSKRLTPPGNVRLVVNEAPTTIIKAATTAFPMDASLTAVPDFSFPMEANGTYEVTAVAGYTTNQIATATPGISYSLTLPAASTVTWWGDSTGTNGTGAAITTTNNNRAFLTSAASLLNSGGITGATPARSILTYRVVCGTAAGNFVIRAGQQTADAVNATSVVAGSLLTYRRVA